jgi:hypothetical protein
MPPDSHYTFADIRLDIGRARLAQGDAGGAEAEFRRALAFREKTMPPASTPVAIASCDLARALAAAGRAGEARTLLESCVPRLKNYGSRSHRAEETRLLQQLRSSTP